MDMNSFDFSCQTPVKVLDIKANLSGNVAGDFIEYTYELNRAVIGKTFEPYQTPEEVIDIYAHYPETTECVGACTLDIDIKRYRTQNCRRTKRLY